MTPSSAGSGFLQETTSEFLRRHASRLSTGGDLSAKECYQELCLTLTAICARLDVVPDKRHWKAALESVLELQSKLRAGSLADFGVEVGTPADIFAALTAQALIDAGVTDRPTILDPENRDAALGLALNWGLRWLIALAHETPAPARRSSKQPPQDLLWLASRVKAAAMTAA